MRRFPLAAKELFWKRLKTTIAEIVAACYSPRSNQLTWNQAATFHESADRHQCARPNRHRAYGGGTRGKDVAAAIRNPCSVLAAGTEGGSVGFVFGRSHFDVDAEGTAPRNPDAARVGHLGATGSRRHPRVRGARLDAGPGQIHMPVSVPFAFALENPPFEVSPDEAIAAVKDVLGSIGDTCPECPPA